MRTRCPACGTTASLDTLITHDAAREALLAALKISKVLGLAIVRYLGLFRPAERELTFDRVARLLAEIQPDIEAQRITRGGQVYEAPEAAWVWAIEQAIAARDDGRLKTPLKSHGYLYEVLTNWRPSSSQLVSTETRPAAPTAPRSPSKTHTALSILERRANGNR